MTRVRVVAFASLLGCAPAIPGSSTMQHLPLRLPQACESAETYEQAHRCTGRLHDVALEIRYGFHQDPRLRAYVERIGSRVAAHAPEPGPTDFVVVDTDAIDAWTTAGNRIYLTRGMLAFVDSEAELAAVLAHEIAHVASGHTDRLLDRAPGLGFEESLVVLDRDTERQADQLAVTYLRRAGYRPQAMQTLMRGLAFLRATFDSTPSWADRHPPPAVRIALIARATDGYRGGRQGITNHMRAIDGLEADGAWRNGMTHNGEFQLPSAGIAIVPNSNWELLEPNDGFQLWVARHRTASLGLGLFRLGDRGSVALSNLFVDMMTDAEETSIAGFPAAFGRIDQLRESALHIEGMESLHAWVFTGREGTQYAFIAYESDSSGALDAARLERVRQFLRPLSVASVSRLVARWSPRRLLIDTDLTEMARRGCGDLEILVAFNRVAPTEPIAAGQWIKCINAAPLASTRESQSLRRGASGD